MFLSQNTRIIHSSVAVVCCTCKYWKKKKRKKNERRLLYSATFWRKESIIIYNQHRAMGSWKLARDMCIAGVWREIPEGILVSSVNSGTLVATNPATALYLYNANSSRVKVYIIWDIYIYIRTAQETWPPRKGLLLRIYIALLLESNKRHSAGVLYRESCTSSRVAFDERMREYQESLLIVLQRICCARGLIKKI